MSTFRARSQQKDLQLTWHVAPDVPLHLVGDPHRLRQVLVNLIGNSIKFTKEGYVDVRVETNSRTATSSCLHFRVTDTGIGIPEEKRAAIFDPFAQADASTTRTFGGTGLGLSISAKLIDLMQGEIWLNSQVGQGSVFHFTAEFGRAPDDADRLAVTSKTPGQLESPHPIVSTSPLRILLVEDNPVNQRVASSLLRKRGHSIQLATNGLEAVSAATERSFDVILMDIQMPEMDGLTATAAIREIDQAHDRHTPIIALTAHTMAGDRERLLEAGMDEYVPKPIRQHELLRVIDKCVLKFPEPIHDAEEETEVSGVFDSAMALELAGDDQVLLQELIEYAINECPSLLGQLRRAVDEDDHSAIADTAHRLKGTFGQMAADQARSAAATLERLAQDDHAENLRRDTLNSNGAWSNSSRL